MEWRTWRRVPQSFLKVIILGNLSFNYGMENFDLSPSQQFFLNGVIFYSTILLNTVNPPFDILIDNLPIDLRIPNRPLSNNLT